MLSPKQKEMYDFIRGYIRDNDISPSYEEIAENMKFKFSCEKFYKNNVSHHLKHLKEEGLISYTPGIPRSIKLINHGILIKGSIAAGDLLEIFSDPEPEWLDVERELMRGNCYALLVIGDSMIGDNIHDGDYVIIREQSVCDDGDIVVARQKIENSVTLKHLFKDQKVVRLEPSNPEVKTRHIPRDEWDRKWEMQGKAIAVFRRLNVTSKSRYRAKSSYRNQK